MAVAGCSASRPLGLGFRVYIWFICALRVLGFGLWGFWGSRVLGFRVVSLLCCQMITMGFHVVRV